MFLDEDIMYFPYFKIFCKYFGIIIGIRVLVYYYWYIWYYYLVYFGIIIYYLCSEEMRQNGRKNIVVIEN